MIVYGDLLFLINFSMDFLSFYISCLILHRKLPTLRAALASVIGGVYAVASLFLNIKQPLALALDIFVLIAMCGVAYCGRGVNAWRFLRFVFVYALASVLLGGIMTALFSLFNEFDFLSGEMGAEDGINVWVFALLALVSSLFTIRGGRFLHSSANKRDVYIEIEENGAMVILHALVDSGNLAVEPISGKAVIFASLEACRDVIDTEAYESLSAKSEIDGMPVCVASRIRLIPSRAIGGSTLLPSLRFKSVKALEGKNTKELDVYVAFVDVASFSEYEAIVPERSLM